MADRNREELECAAGLLALHKHPVIFSDAQVQAQHTQQVEESVQQELQLQVIREQTLIDNTAAWQMLVDQAAQQTEARRGAPPPHPSLTRLSLPRQSAAPRRTTAMPTDTPALAASLTVETSIGQRQNNTVPSSTAAPDMVQTRTQRASQGTREDPIEASGLEGSMMEDTGTESFWTQAELA